jgi:hypothetical protein
VLIFEYWRRATGIAGVPGKLAVVPFRGRHDRPACMPPQ